MQDRVRSSANEIAPLARRVPTAPVTPAATLLALQRGAGNRAVATLARRVIGTDPSTRVVRLAVGVELTTKLAQKAWELTVNGPLDEAGIDALRQIALEHWFGTIDDSERLFIAALLDRGNAAKLHATYPGGFSKEGSEIDFSAASITAVNRQIVQDFGRSQRPEPGPYEESFTKDKLDQDIIAMGRPGFTLTATQVLRLADEANVNHVSVYFAMLNGASDSTPGDRAFAGAAFVIARRAGMAVAQDILGGRLKVDEVSTVLLNATGTSPHAMYSPEADGRLKGDTLYLPTTFDIDNLAHLGTLVHELQHASDDGAATTPTTASRLDAEEAAYERQARFLLAELEKLSGKALETAETQVGERVGQTHLYLMILATVETAEGARRARLERIVTEVNQFKAKAAPGTELGPGELALSLSESPDASRAKARASIADYNKREKRPSKVILRGFRGESVLDAMPAPAAKLPRDLGRTKLQRDPKDAKPRTFEQTISVDQIEMSVGDVNVSSGITLDLLKAAQKRISKGPIKGVDDLLELRKIALADQTISDAERLFLAALLDPEDARRIAAVDLNSPDGPRLKLRFVLDEETEKRIHAVELLGRPAPGKGSSEEQIRGLADGRAVAATALLQFAKERKLAPADVLSAMQTAASDFTIGDMLAAGSAYAVAAAAGHPEAGDLKAGRIRVDEMPLGATTAAEYIPTGSGGTWKGDTIYLKPEFDITSVYDRASVIHELTHAAQDKARKTPEAVSKSELEPEAYIAGGAYALDELSKFKAPARTAAIKQVAKKWGRHDLFGAVIASRADSARFLPLLKKINELVPSKNKLGDEDFKADESALRAKLLLEIHATSSHCVMLTGLTGESVFDVQRTLARTPRMLQRDGTRPGIHVHQGSRLTAAQFISALTSDKKVPRWLTQAVASSRESLVGTGTLAAPQDRIWLFVEPFEDAIKSGGWEITTARSIIEVTEDADQRRRWHQVVIPDLQKGERLGTWFKSGPDQEELMRTTFVSNDPEVIYGWTQPDQATSLTHEKHGFVLIVTEIEVTAPNGKKRKFRPRADDVAEAMLHEISVHAGRISEGKPDVHDDRDAAVKDVVDQVGEFFRPGVRGSETLEVSPLTKEIFKFVSESP
jgi:hypothetical protein